jgi:hypothetical protein
MVPNESRTVVIGGAEMLAEAILNNCSDLWTATVRADGRLVASGAGVSAAAAISSAVERATAALRRNGPVRA